MTSSDADQGIAGVLSTRKGRLRLELRRIMRRSGRVMARSAVDADSLVGVLRDLPQACEVLLEGADRPEPFGETAGPKLELSDLGPVPRIREPLEIEPLDLGRLGEVDLEALEELDGVVRFEESGAPPVRKEARWLGLAIRRPIFADLATRRAAEWGRFRTELDAFHEVQRGRASARDRDWDRLSRFLRLRVVSDRDKIRWSRAFVAAYGGSPPANPHTIDLRRMLANGSLRSNRHRPRPAHNGSGGAAPPRGPGRRGHDGGRDADERTTPQSVQRAHFVINGFVGTR